MKLNRNSKLFINYFLGPLIFIWLSWSIYVQVKNQPELSTAWKSIKESVSGPLALNLVLVVALMLVNWSIEAIKWKISVNSIQQVGFSKALRAIFSGVSFAVSTPNRIGEYLGRMLYMDEGNRLRTISITIVGSMSQLLVTCIMGAVALFTMRQSLVDHGLISPLLFNVVSSGVLIFTFGLLVFYFRLSWLTSRIEKLPGIKRFAYLLSAIDDLPVNLLLKLLALSLARFVVFIAQYALLFPLFAVDVSLFQVFCGVSVSFLVMSVIPTVAIIELPLRGKTLTTIVGIFTVNHLGIGLTTAVIWLTNLVIPAIIGSVLMLGLRKLVKE